MLTTAHLRGVTSASHSPRRRLVSAVLTASALLAACSVTPPLTPEEYATLHPTPSTTSLTPVAGRQVRDQPYVAGGSPAQKLDLTVPGGHVGPRPVVVFIHGGGWESGDRASFDRADGPGFVSLRDALLAQGWATVSVDYRLSSAAPMPAQLDDVKAAVRWVYAHAGRYGLDRGRIAVAGESAGGHLAQLLGTTRGRDDLEGHLGTAGTSSVVAVVSFYGVSDIGHLVADRVAAGCGQGDHGPRSPEGKLLGADPQSSAGAQKAAAASPVTYVSRSSAPTLFLHGRQDCVVPKAQSERASAALSAAGVATDLVLIDGGHADRAFYDRADLRQRVVGFLFPYLEG